MFKGLFIKYSDYSLEKQILTIIGVAGLSFSVLTSIMNLFLDLGLLLVMTTIGTGLSSYMVLHLAHKSNDVLKASYFGLSSLMLLLYPSLWMLNGGSSGPTVLFMLFNAVPIAVLLNFKGYIRMLLLQILSFLVLLLIEYRNPELIQGYSNQLSRTVDYSFSFILVFISSLIVVVKVMKVYRKNIDELEKIHLELVKANEVLKIKSETDEMTGIFNRRYMMDSLEGIIRIKPTTQQTAIIMIDIDYFKSINDTYGHCFGDEVIKRVSETLSENLRRTDIIGRIGGEEFLIVMPEISKEDTIAKVETLRKLISEIKWKNNNLRVTISIGAYFLKGHETLDQALEQVDIGLYEAKNSGRNKSVIVGV